MSDTWGTGLDIAQVKGKDGKPPDKWDFIQAVANAPVAFNNYSGSCAGAGSGDFHMYRNWRRKEFSRLSQMDRDAKKELKLKEFDEQRDARLKEHEDQVSKKQDKRKRKKEREKAAKKAKIEEAKAAKKTGAGAEKVEGDEKDEVAEKSEEEKEGK